MGLPADYSERTDNRHPLDRPATGDGMGQSRVIGLTVILLASSLSGCMDSENGKSSGVGFINADVLPFSNNKKILKTHVGWNKVQGNSQLLKKLNIKPNSYFYFCHSFYLNINNENNIKYSHTTFKKKFPSILVKDNFVGTQFHPEKSQNNGLKLLNNFLKI